MKAYLFLLIGARWIIVSILFSLGKFSFLISWPKGSINPATINTVSRLALPVIVFGWIVPTGLGLWHSGLKDKPN